MEIFAEKSLQDGGLAASVMAARLLLALVLGAIVGFEREWRKHSAGLRTHMLISLSACVFALLALQAARANLFTGGEFRMDPMRLIEAITNGVAFLAAGTIAFARGRVIGLTTGAGMWLAGAVGLSSGLGFWQLGIMSTAGALIVLWLLRYLERGLVSPQKSKGEDNET